MKEEHLEQVERREQIEPPLDSSNDKEVSTKAHSFVTIPLETYHEPPISSFQCLEEPSYVVDRVLKDPLRNTVPRFVILCVCFLEDLYIR